MYVSAYKLALLKQYVRRTVVDLLLIPLAFYVALFIQYDGKWMGQELEVLSRYVLPISLVYIVINMVFGIYRRLWAFASFRDVFLLSETVGLGTLILVVTDVFVLSRYLDQRLPTGTFIIGGLLTFISSAIVKYRRQLLEMLLARWNQDNGSKNVERVLIVGVNETAQQLVNRIYLGRNSTYEVAGFVDGDADDVGMNINGVEILGTVDHIPEIVEERGIDVIVIACRPCSLKEMWRLISTCQKTTAQLKVLPDVVDILEGQYEDPFALQDISIEDILGRSPVEVDVESCRRILEGKVVMVTGAAGSIGSELCRQILNFDPHLLVALDNNETGLFELNMELGSNGNGNGNGNGHGHSPLQLALSDVTDWHRINRIFERYKPQVVFHAAAYKHVPLMEAHPEEALRVNVIGTVILGEVAHRYGAERFVFVSTDKAVRPSSVMGASKRIGELWMKALSAESETSFSAVRFGNVIGSRGSVIPTFTQQIKGAGPVTVTSPDMHRFFISIPEAVSLVLQAATFGRSGEIFMLDMGEEVPILDLAHRMIRMKGLRVGRDVAIEFVGMRPGEKLHEELAYEFESKMDTSHPRIYSLWSSEELIDRETLLGIVSIMSQMVKSPEALQSLQEGFFQVASQDIDAFLNEVFELGVRQDQRRLTRAWA